MNTKEIAGWFRELLSVYNELSVTGDKKFNLTPELASIWLDRAAQVEAMTCDGCRWWEKEDDGVVIQIGSFFDWCNNQNVRVEGFGPKFGCIHFEKAQDGRGEG